ncbi:hypothetical protein HK405_007570, partial [Cladochytrium tenue]
MMSRIRILAEDKHRCLLRNIDCSDMPQRSGSDLVDPPKSSALATRAATAADRHLAKHAQHHHRLVPRMVSDPELLPPRGSQGAATLVVAEGTNAGGALGYG